MLRTDMMLHITEATAVNQRQKSLSLLPVLANIVHATILALEAIKRPLWND